MLRKIFWQGLILLILFVLPNSSGAMSDAGAASRSIGYESIAGEQAKADLPGGESAGTITVSPGLGAVTASYYSIVYDKEYFYRTDNSQPIRDYRYYKVKTIIPPSEKKNYVLRDFRRGMWENKSYNK